MLKYKPDRSRVTDKIISWPFSSPSQIEKGHKFFQVAPYSSMCLSIFLWVDQKILWFILDSWMWTQSDNTNKSATEQKSLWVYFP